MMSKQNPSLMVPCPFVSEHWVLSILTQILYLAIWLLFIRRKVNIGKPNCYIDALYLSGSTYRVPLILIWQTPFMVWPPSTLKKKIMEKQRCYFNGRCKFGGRH